MGSLVCLLMDFAETCGKTENGPENNDNNFGVDTDEGPDARFLECFNSTQQKK